MKFWLLTAGCFGVGGRPPHGGRGLKCTIVGTFICIIVRRPPHGGRGLKSVPARNGKHSYTSPPARGAWIEIGSSALRGWLYRSPPARGAWIEMKIKGQHTPPRYSRPPHGGRGLKYAVFALYQVVGGRPPHGGRGLKLCCVRYIFYAYAVAPRTGGVD